MTSHAHTTRRIITRMTRRLRIALARYRQRCLANQATYRAELNARDAAREAEAEARLEDYAPDMLR